MYETDEWMLCQVCVTRTSVVSNAERQDCAAFAGSALCVTTVTCVINATCPTNMTCRTSSPELTSPMSILTLSGTSARPLYCPVQHGQGASKSDRKAIATETSSFVYFY